MQIHWSFDYGKLLALRELKNLSRKDCARSIDKTVAAYGLKERGRSPFTVDEICALANTFGIDPRSFFIKKSNDEQRVA